MADLSTLKRYVTPRACIVFGLIALVGFAYCQGDARGRASIEAHEYEVARKMLVDSAHFLRDSEATHEVALIERRDDATKARVAHAKAASRLVPTSDNTIRVDGGEAQTLVPASLVVPEIRTAHAALVSDSLALLAAASALGFAQQRAEVNDHRADAAETQLKKSHRRFGFKSGVVATLLVIAGLAKVFK